MKDLEGRTALVTGASRGIGPHIARALADQGMNLVLTARSREQLEGVANGLPTTANRALCIEADLNDPRAIEPLVDQAEAWTSGIDVLINNAAIEDVEAFDQAELERLDDVIDVNLRAPMMLARLLIPRMIARGRGHIVNVSSLNGLGGSPFQEAYCATKHGLVGFSRSLHATARAQGYPVGCSVVCPGFVGAGMYEDLRRQSGATAPPAFGVSSPQRVAGAVVRAIVQNQPEVIVNPTPVRPLLVLALFAPRLAAWLIAKLGASGFFDTVRTRRPIVRDSREDRRIDTGPVPWNTAP